MVAQSFKDMERLEHLPNDRHFDVGLWKTSDFPRVMVSKWDEFGTLASKNNSMWSFWREWYQGFLDGKPMDWELQRRVALIEDDIWKAGPEAVAEEIERIRDKFTLEQEIAALKDKLAKTVEGFDAPHRGHNQPPELIDDARVMQREFTLIWNDLQDLESEVQKDEPSPKAIRKYALRLWEISQTILKHCGSVGDATIKAAAKTIGAALGTALATEAIAPGTVQSVAKMALDYAMKLGAG
ncbi:hypothetical protein ROG8370_03586 [Roseovarius gaetbuli]|uniref:Uncharacterized protein n=2 Tax=Roseovarius gaetbuli TaxID=1356575 RepID=A0A1X7AB21_9RHOB|nr:hypothetical protein ROG8370_03586 [Roseovarius gaetbuli]